MSAGEEEALFTAVYARPFSDEPRLVLADFLQQRGDPRGELITLQYLRPDAPESLARQAELLQEHSERWLGELAVVVRSVVFRRGFPYAGRLDRAAGAAALAHRREWSTFEELGFGLGARAVPAMRGLRVVQQASDAVVADLCASEVPWAVESLEWSVASDPALLEALGATPNLPALRVLRVGRVRGGDRNARRWVETAPLAKQLTLLEIGRDRLIGR